MSSLAESLKGNFVVANLGCIGDADYTVPESLLRTLTVIEIDAGGAAQTSHRYHRKISVGQVVSAQAGPAIFRRNRFVGSCSLLTPKPGVVAAYGIERYHDLVEELKVSCVTVPAILEANELSHLDFLKTDLEGMDFAVLQSCEAQLPKLLAVQCELHFEPFYPEEPPFHRVAEYLSARGFELRGLYAEFWKFKTKNRFFQSHGNPAWGDFVFFRRSAEIMEWPADQRALAFAKQVIIAVMVDRKNLAEHILDQARPHLHAEWLPPLEKLVKPSLPSLGELMRSLRKVFWPFELKLRYLVGSSRHVATK